MQHIYAAFTKVPRPEHIIAHECDECFKLRDDLQEQMPRQILMRGSSETSISFLYSPTKRSSSFFRFTSASAHLLLIRSFQSSFYTRSRTTFAFSQSTDILPNGDRPSPIISISSRLISMRRWIQNFFRTRGRCGTLSPNPSLQATAGRSGATIYIMKLHPLQATPARQRCLSSFSLGP